MLDNWMWHYYNICKTLKVIEEKNTSEYKEHIRKMFSFLNVTNFIDVNTNEINTLFVEVKASKNDTIAQQQMEKDFIEGTIDIGRGTDEMVPDI